MSNESAGKSLNVDIDLLVAARTSWDRSSTEFYLDAETGQIVTMPVVVLKGEAPIPDGAPELVEVLPAIQAGDARYVHIDPLPQRAEQILMERFVESVTDAGLKQQLGDASKDPKGFRMFRRILHAAPEERNRWNAFRAKHLNGNAEKWLASKGLKTTQTPGGP